MAQCRHNHTPLKQADKWTKFAMIGEGVASFISDGYWMGGTIDLAFSLKDDGLGLSWYGLGFGAGLSLATAIGTAYAHTMLNLNHQEEEETPDETTGLINQSDGHHHHHDHAHAEHHHDAHAHPAANSRLRPLQKLALVGDFISHTGDIAGPITFVAKIAAQERLPVWGTALIQCSATLFGGLASVANVRTCAKSMRDRNRHANHELHVRNDQHEEEQHSLGYQAK